MFQKRALFILLSVILAAILVGGGFELGGIAHALPPSQESSTTGLTIPYPGHLVGQDGQPVADGAYDFAFALYDATEGGVPLWSEVQKGVQVKGGAFLISLGSTAPIPMATMEGGERWLEVAVQGPGESELTSLAPRQQLRSAEVAPAQAAPCAHTHWGEMWTGSDAALYLDASASSGAQIWFNGMLTSILSVGTYGTGVYGKSEYNSGVLGESTDYYGGFFTSGSDHKDIGLGGTVGRINAADTADSELYLSANGSIVLKLDNDSGGDNYLVVRNSAGTDVCAVDEAGNLGCTGGKSAVVQTADYGWRKLWAVESPDIWFEDAGSAALVDGQATVPFEAIFHQTVNTEEEYHVYLTPISDEPVWLYVTAKTGQGFTVKGVTMDGRPAQCTFDYRVMAKRLGYETVHLPATDWQTQEVEP